MRYKIGNLKLKNRFLLAPMLEPNDIAFRFLCKKAGCGLTYTGMISPMSKQKMVLDDKPAVQLFGNSAKGIKNFMKKYDSKVSLWDFNLGCPSKLSKRLGHGGCLDDLGAIEDILKVMRSATRKSITIKLRKSDKAIEIARMAERYVDAIGIHARTVGQGYSGEVDYDFALNLKKAVSVPVIYSGGVSEKNVSKILKDFDFVFVGRECIGNPKFFLGKNLVGSNNLVVRSGFSFEDYLDLAKKYGLFFRQIKFQAINWTKGLKNAKGLRARLVGAKDVEEIREIMVKNK